MPPVKRLDKINSLLRTVIGESISRVFRNGVLITVTRVKTSPDLTVAVAYCSVYPSEKEKDIINSLNDKKNRHLIHLGKADLFMKRTPKLEFRLDTNQNIDGIHTAR
ncbi:MAG: ribosome-binding factor A [Candidatus Campbellbacteria bacterium]|nr:ribosome-binding factor A [Candidatus Campbellbacteria bacterium]